MGFDEIKKRTSEIVKKRGPRQEPCGTHNQEDDHRKHVLG